MAGGNGGVFEPLDDEEREIMEAIEAKIEKDADRGLVAVELSSMRFREQLCTGSRNPNADA